MGVRVRVRVGVRVGVRVRLTLTRQAPAAARVPETGGVIGAWFGVGVG